MDGTPPLTMAGQIKRETYATSVTAKHFLRKGRIILRRKSKEKRVSNPAGPQKQTFSLGVGIGKRIENRLVWERGLQVLPGPYTREVYKPSYRSAASFPSHLIRQAETKKTNSTKTVFVFAFEHSQTRFFDKPRLDAGDRGIKNEYHIR